MVMLAGAPLLKTKLYIPRARPNLVPRPRLIRRLNEAVERSLTLVSAPAGFGKTTLLSEWIPQCQKCVAWLSLDDGDNDPARFWMYVVATLQRLSADLGEMALSLLQSPQPPPIESVVTLVVNDVAEFTDRFSLVLDDYHVINIPAIHESLALLIDHIPPQIHLVITSRADPPLPLARLRVRGQITEIRAADLRFTPAEAAAFLNQATGLTLPAGAIAAVEARTEGWIAGLQLAALAMSEEGTRQASPPSPDRMRQMRSTSQFVKAFADSNTYVVDYLVEEVLRGQSEETERFLLHTSVLDRLSGSLCDAVVGPVGDWSCDSQTALEQLDRANLFLTPLDGERQWYRYHPLFADVLRSRLRQAHPDRVPELHRRAAAWFAQNDLIAEAVHHALAARDFDQVADLVERTATAMRKRGEMATLRGWIDQLPAEVVRARPWLGLIRALGFVYTHQLDAAERCAQDVEQAVRGTRLEAELMGELLALRARLAHRHNDFLRAVELAEQALALIPPSDMLLRGQVALVLGNVSYYSDRPAASIRAFAESARLAEEAGDLHTALNAICNQGIMQTIGGQLRQAAITYRHGLQLAADRKAERLPINGALHTNLATVLYEWNELESAAAHLREAVERSDGGQDPYAMMLSRAHLARTLQALGNADGAEQAIQRALDIARERNMPRLSTVDAMACRVAVWLMQGNRAALAQWVRDSGLGADDALSAVQEPEHIALARVLIALGETDPALRLLDRLLAAAVAGQRRVVQIELRALQALAFRTRNDADQALAVLDQALSLAEPEGYLRTFVDAGEPMRLLVADLRPWTSDDRLRSYADTLLAAFPSPATTVQSEIRFPISEMVEPLTDRELEVLRLVADGLSDRQVADRLTVVVGTVKRHLNNLYGKLGAHSRTQALARARELGLL